MTAPRLPRVIFAFCVAGHCLINVPLAAWPAVLLVWYIGDMLLGAFE